MMIKKIKIKNRTQHPTEGFACLSHKAHAGSTVWLARHTPQVGG